jgi:hypothetical protein
MDKDPSDRQLGRRLFFNFEERFINAEKEDGQRFDEARRRVLDKLIGTAISAISDPLERKKRSLSLEAALKTERPLDSLVKLAEETGALKGVDSDLEILKEYYVLLQSRE